MAYVLCYTKCGEGVYPDYNYPGHVAYNCDVEHAMYLAVSQDGKKFNPLRNNTGILFPKASFKEDNLRGVTKTLIDPWICRTPEGGFLISAIRRNQNAPDSESIGSMILYYSKDLVFYQEVGFCRLAMSEIRHPRISYEKENECYYIEWEVEGTVWCGYISDFGTSKEKKIAFEAENMLYNVQKTEQKLYAAEDIAIPECILGNIIEITDSEMRTLCNYLGEVRNIGVAPVEFNWPYGKSLEKEKLPKAICLYNDGSFHEKKVEWDEKALKKVDVFSAGEYSIPGKIQQKSWPFPMKLNFGKEEIWDYDGMSDPCITEYRGRFYLTSSCSNRILLRAANTIEETFSSEPIVIYEVPNEKNNSVTNTWASELHEIDGRLYLFTSLCPNGDWTKVKSCVLRCRKNPENPDDWEKPKLCVKKDGTILTENGISLDMTYFRDGDVDYVMWSDRKVWYDAEILKAGTADIYIAVIDPSAPWCLISEPHCVVRPMYGWDRYETEVDEGPYLLRRGNDLFVTISGSSTAMGDLYDVGLLHAKSGTDLLDAENWEWLPYPLLTKESIPGQYGPGHNNFVKDPDTGDDLMVYHAVMHDENGKTLHRQPGIRRVHWAKTGLPYLEMTSERDLLPEFEKIEMRLVITKGE